MCIRRVRWPKLALSVLCGWLLGTRAEALAAPPQINNIAPAGLQRGVAAELTITGSNLSGNPRLIAPFECTQIPRPSGSSDSTWKLTLTIAPETAVAVYPIRVQTDDGLSNPFLLAVGQVPQVAEKEDNSFFESAQPIPDLPVVVEGQLAGNDVDFFRFRGKKGQRIVLDAQCARIGSGVDPTIRLTTADFAARSFVGSADDSPGLLSDARFVAQLPEDADYVVEISDSRYQGTGRPVYRLLIGPVLVADEIYPLGGRLGETVGLELRGGTIPGVKLAAATLNPFIGTDRFPPRIKGATLGICSQGAGDRDVESLPALVASPYAELREPNDPSAPPPRAVAPVVFNGRLEKPGDVDRFVLVVAPGERLRIKVQASELGSALDGLLQVRGNNDEVIATADDTSITLPARRAQQVQTLVLPDPSLDLTVPGRTSAVTLVLRDLENRGGDGFPYRIVVEPGDPDFELVLGDSQVAVPSGGSATVGVAVRRKGYTGPIALAAADLPAGLSARAGTIAAGQTAGVLSLSATPEAAFTPASIKVIGRAEGRAPLERQAFKPVVFAEQANFPVHTRTQFGTLVAPARPSPVNLTTPVPPIDVPHGLSANIPIQVARSKGADAALTISALALPPGLKVANATIAEKAGQGTVTVKSELEAALGTMTIALQAKGRFAGVDRTIALPVPTVRVVHPASLALETATIEAKPGSSAELKGRVVRVGVFDGPVTVKINGLPAGVNAEPVSVARGVSSFRLKLAVDAKAPPSTTTAQAVLAFQVEKKDYSIPSAPVLLKVLAAR
jgi:hypothetical protein